MECGDLSPLLSYVLRYWSAKVKSKAATSRRTRAPESASGQRGESPLQAGALRPVTDSNCDAAMRGGEQLEVNGQSVGKRTRFGQVTSASWRVNSEAQTGDGKQSR